MGLSIKCLVVGESQSKVDDDDDSGLALFQSISGKRHVRGIAILATRKITRGIQRVMIHLGLDSENDDNGNPGSVFDVFILRPIWRSLRAIYLYRMGIL